VRRRLFILYGLYGFGVTLFFAFVLFPGDEAALSVRGLWNRHVPGAELRLESISPTLPAALNFEEAAVLFGKGGAKKILFDTLRLEPDFLSLLQGFAAVRLSAETFGGLFSGRVRPSGRLTVRGPLSAELTVRDLELDALNRADLLGGRSLTGLLNGKFSFQGVPGRVTEGEGTAAFDLKDGSIGLYGNVLGISVLSFDRLEGLCSLRDRTVSVEKVVFSGSQITGSFSGNIYLTRDLERSRLALTGTIRIPPLNRDVATVIGGTASVPTVRLR